MKTSQPPLLMHKKSNRVRQTMRSTLLLALVCIGASGYANTVDKPLGFEAVFAEKGQPATLHFTSTFRVDGMDHKLEVWRLHDEHLKRVTDGTLEVHVERKSGDPEFHMTVMDRKKNLLTEIDRTNLYQIGNFTDWFDLAHGIKHPMGPYQLARGSKPVGMPAAVEPCDWFDLKQGPATTHICWSGKNKLPLLIGAQDGQLLWQVTQVDRKPIVKKAFEIHDAGFIRNNANDDIAHD